MHDGGGRGERTGWLRVIAAFKLLKALDKLRFLSGRRAVVLGTAALLYAGLFATEGVGLWLGERWAEWLTVVATGLLIPVEIYELIHGATAPRILALVGNVAMVAYLVVRIRRSR